jgi:ABC-type phosphate/phosphonate transport system substrate-binding protein
LRALLAGAVLPVLVVLTPAPRAGAADPQALKIGLSESMFNGLPASVVGPAAKPFQGMFEKQTGLKGEIVIAKDFDDMTGKLRTGALDVAVLHGFEYAWVQKDAGLVPLLVTVPSHKLEACLVVNVDSKAEGPKDLKGGCVAVPAATKAHCRLYHDRLREKLPEGCCRAAKDDGASVEDALDACASGKCEAVLADASALAGYQRNKPGVGSRLKVLDRSAEFPSAVIVYRKDAFDADTAKRIRNGLIRGVSTPQGQLLTGLWRLKGFAGVTPAYRAQLERSLKAFPAPNK